MGYEWSPINSANVNNAAYGQLTQESPIGSGVYATWGMVWYDDTPAPSSPSYGQASQYSYQVQVPFEYYADVTATTDIPGFLAAQTLVMPRAGWIPQLEMFYDEIGPAGAIDLLVTRCTNGVPDATKVLSRVTVARNDLKKYPAGTLIPIIPCKVSAGERIGFIEITQGSHSIVMADAGYSEGTFFRGSPGGGYLQGDLTKDRKMRVYMANFVQPRTELLLQNISLAGGISDLKILTEQPKIDGATMHYEAQIAGVWKPLTGFNLGALAGLPDIVPLRAVFVGTSDIQHGLQLGAGRVVGSRPALSSTIVSNAITVSAKRYFQVDLVVNRWDPAKNTITMQILTGGSYATVTASATSVVIDENSIPGWKRLRCTFDVGSTVNSYKVKTIITRAADGLPVRRMELTAIATG